MFIFPLQFIFLFTFKSNLINASLSTVKLLFNSTLPSNLLVPFTNKFLSIFILLDVVILPIVAIFTFDFAKIKSRFKFTYIQIIFHIYIPF